MDYMHITQTHFLEKREMSIEAQHQTLPLIPDVNVNKIVHDKLDISLAWLTRIYGAV